MSKFKLRGGAKKSNQVNPYKVYGDLLFSHKTRGLSDRPVPLNDSSIQLCYNKCYSGNEVMFFYQVSSFGDTVQSELLSAVRSRVRGFYEGKVYIDMLSKAKPYKIKWKSGAMKDNRRVWQMYKKRASNAKRQSEKEGYVSAMVRKAFARQERNEMSWNHYQRCEEERIGICLYSCVFRVRLPKDDEYQITAIEEDLDDFFKLEGISVKRISLFMYDFMSELSPFKHESTKMASKLLADRGMTSDITARLLSSDQGKMSGGQIYLGNDIYSRDTAYLDLLPKTQSMTNTWLIGGSGAGKSTLTKNIIEQALAWGFYTYVNDYEQSEYDPIGETYGATFLDLGSGNGRYFEPFRLSTPTGIDKLDSEIWSSAVSNTFAYMNTFKGSALTVGQKSIVSKAINELLKESGVSKDDMSTWGDGITIGLHSIFTKVRSFKFSKNMMAEFGSELTELINTLEMFFGEDGIYRHMFTNPIVFDELKDSKFIITRFGRDAKKSVTFEESIDISIKQLTKIILETELGRYIKSKGEHFLTIYEEVQNYLEHEGSAELLETLFAAVRKLNGTAIGVINDPSKLNSRLFGLLSNSENFVIGRLNDSTALGDLMKLRQLRGCEPLINRLSVETNCFFYRTGYTRTIFKCQIPKAHVNGPIYSTRDTEFK